MIVDLFAGAIKQNRNLQNIKLVAVNRWKQLKYISWYLWKYCILYAVYYMLYIILTVYIVCCILYTMYYILYTIIYCICYTVYYMLYREIKTPYSGGVPCTSPAQLAQETTRPSEDFCTQLWVSNGCVLLILGVCLTDIGACRLY